MSGETPSPNAETGKNAGRTGLKAPPVHPGQILLQKYINPLGMTQSAFAVRLGVSFPRLNEVVKGHRSVTPDTALRLARVLGTAPDFWLDLQQHWDLWQAMTGPGADEISRLEPIQRIKQGEA